MAGTYADLRTWIQVQKVCPSRELVRWISGILKQFIPVGHFRNQYNKSYYQ